jgi:hypothetical protein
MQRRLRTPASSRLIVKSTLLEATRHLPVTLATHTTILHLEDLSLPHETIAITPRPKSAGAMWMITGCVGLRLRLPVTSLALDTTVLRTRLHILAAILLQRLEITTDTIGGPLLPMKDTVVTLLHPLL